MNSVSDGCACALVVGLTFCPVTHVKAGGCMHVRGVAHGSHFSIMLQQDGVIGDVGVAMGGRWDWLLLHKDAVLVKLHGHVQMSGSVGAWH